MQKNRFQLTPAVFMIFRKNSKILLLRRFNTGWRDGQYTVPSGHINGSETASAAAAREAFEEVGAKINLMDLKFVQVMHRRADEGDHERVDFFFEVLNYKGKLTNAEPEKCDDFQWFDIKHLPENTIPVVKSALDRISEGKYYTELNFD